ncbi:DUF1327 domain-containing protein [Escherichia coli]|uniref:DUF1327 domain-containing protein n=1 Tax=Escherichia coli TaxID=562 RepID=UPI00093A9C92|nr:DUF1327 domain-containing protein [Escherichia coli]
MTQDYELVVKGVRNFENKVTVTVALQDKERFDGEIFDLDVAMDRVEGAALEFYEAAARRSVLIINIYEHKNQIRPVGCRSGADWCWRICSSDT